MNKPRPHVILIAYHFPPSSEIGARRPARFYKWLRRMGYECDVITATARNSADSGISYIPDELHDLWEKGSGERHSVAAYSELLLRQVMFPGHLGMIWSRRAAARCQDIVRSHPHERFVLFCTYPPLGALLTGLSVQRRWRIPWIADFRDPFAALVLEGEPWRIRFWNSRFEHRVFRSASAIIANTEPAAKVWGERYTWAKPKLHAIYNGFDPEEAPVARPTPPHDYKLLVHAGSFYHGRNPNLVIESLLRLRLGNVQAARSVRILLLGTSGNFALADQALYEQAQRDGWLELRPPVPHTEAQGIIGEADGLLLFDWRSAVQVPAKLYEYICVGRPVLATVLRSSQVEPILTNAGVPHVCIYSDDSPRIVDAKMMDFLRLPNTPSRMNDWFQSNFNSKEQTQKLAAIIESIAQEHA